MPPLTQKQEQQRYGVQIYDHEPVPNKYAYGDPDRDHDLERIVDAKRMDAILRREVCWRCSIPLPTGLGFGRGQAFVAAVKCGDYGAFEHIRSLKDAARLVEEERCPFCTTFCNDVMIDLQRHQDRVPHDGFEHATEAPPEGPRAA